MEKEMESSELNELYSSLPKGTDSSPNSEDFLLMYNKIWNMNTDDATTDAGNTLIESILKDDKSRLVSLTKRFLKTPQSDDDSLSSNNEDVSTVSKLLRLCCMFDSVECASALLNGDVAGIMPRVNEVDVSGGRSPLHTAAEVHATRCIELLLRKRARTDLTTRDGESRLALELSLCSRRMDVIWTVNDPIEDLLICLNQKDLTAVSLLCEKTKEVGEVAHALAMDGKVVSLAALLMVAAKKVTGSIVDETAIYDCVIKETLSLSLTESSFSGKETCTSNSTKSSSETSEKRKRLLCEIELLQLYGAVAQNDNGDKNVISPLICASKAGDAAVVEILLKTKANLNDTDGEGNSALHWSLKMPLSSASKQITIVYLLLKHGARLGQKNKMGLTALHYAAANGSLHALQVLLFEDPNGVYVTTEIKETPLFFAVRNDHMECVKILLQWGANTKVLNIRKQRPIDFARSQDMRFILNKTNISSACSTQRKSVLHIDGVCSEACKSISEMKVDDPTTERISPGMNAQVCKYFDSLGGCVRGDKCFYAHCKEIKNEPKGFHFQKVDSTRKIFVGGLPPAFDSESLSKYFEQFGLVEEANVIGVHGNEKLSRGFGFVTFVHKKSVAAAVQAHYVCILGKQVEIKSAVLKGLIQSELQIPTHQPQQEQEKTSPLEVYTPSTPSIDTRITDDPIPETAAVQAHHVCTLGKQAEIKSAIPKNPIQSELQIPAHQPQQKQERTSSPELYTPLTPSIDVRITDDSIPEKLSWVDRLLRGQEKTCSTMTRPKANLSPASVNSYEPAWLRTFKKWLPMYLKEVNAGMGQGQWYALSSVKIDFKNKCGIELDHSSLGYSKFSDFMKSLHSICQTKIVPNGRLGTSTHMILLPILEKPTKKLVQQIKKPDPAPSVQPTKVSDVVVSCADKVDEKGTDDSLDSKFLEDILSISYDNIPLIGKSIECGYQGNEVIAKRIPDPPVTIHPRLLQFMKPDSIFHARPWLTNVRDVCTNVNCGCAVGKNQINEQRNLVLEALTRKQCNSFFLRDLDFFEHYEACKAQGKCFACNQQKAVWENFPCQHLLWCSECKGEAMRAAGSLEHKCVICNVRVLEFVTPNEIYAPQKEFLPRDLVPYNEIYAPQKEFLPYDQLNVGRLPHSLRLRFPVPPN